MGEIEGGVIKTGPAQNDEKEDEVKKDGRENSSIPFRSPLKGMESQK